MSGREKDTREHMDRLKDMSQRSGLQFASDLKEFDLHTGLAKFGTELSDDDDDAPGAGAMGSSGERLECGWNVIGVNLHGLLGVDGRFVDARPSRDTVAYDSDYDNSDVEME